MSGLQLELLEPQIHQHSGLRVVMRMHTHDGDSATQKLGGAFAFPSGSETMDSRSIPSISREKSRIRS